MNPVDAPNLPRRSACDRCRAKRVRCPRAGDSTSPCSHCINAGTICITGAPGNPGRPRKIRKPPSSVTVTASMPGYWPPPHTAGSDLGGADASSSLPVDQPAARWMSPGLESGTSLPGLVDDLGQAANIPFPSNGHVSETSLHEGNSGFWSATSTEPTFFDQLSSPLQHQGSLGTLHHLNLLHAGLTSNDKDPLHPVLDLFDSISSPDMAPQLSVANRLMRLRDKMDHHVTTMTGFFSNPHQCVEGREEVQATGTEPAAPVALFLECINEFTGIIQSLTAVSLPSKGTNTLSPDNHHSAMAVDAELDSPLSSEIILLLLCCYLALMRLCDTLFIGVCFSFGQMAPEALKSVKVKAVFRIGGVPLLQDMSAKAYATSIAEIIQTQIQQVERSLGIPPAYCLAREGSRYPSRSSTLGILAGGFREQLFHAVMQQEDMKAYRGSKSCVQSIRENLEKTVAFFD